MRVLAFQSNGLTSRRNLTQIEKNLLEIVEQRKLHENLAKILHNRSILQIMKNILIVF